MSDIRGCNPRKPKHNSITNCLGANANGLRVVKESMRVEKRQLTIELLKQQSPS